MRHHFAAPWRDDASTLFLQLLSILVLRLQIVPQLVPLKYVSLIVPCPLLPDQSQVGEIDDEFKHLLPIVLLKAQ